MEGLIALAANVASTTVLQPIDVIKTNYQVESSNRTPIASLARRIYADHGARGFFRGLGPQLSTYPIFWSIYFQTKSMKVDLTGNKIADNAVKSYGASVVASALANPLFVVKTRLQTFESNVRPSILGMMKRLHTEGGYSPFFRGLPATIANNTKLAIQFPMYDVLKEDYGYSSFTSSLVSKLSTSSLFYPLDLVRVQQRNASGLSSMEILKSIYSSQGVRGFYRGLLLYNAVSTPSFVLMMVIKDTLTDYFKSDDDEEKDN